MNELPDEPTFRYRATCSHPGCDRTADTKVAAPWSAGAGRELKNYGLACEVHREPVLAQARERRAALAIAEEETVGPVGLYDLIAGRLDAEATPRPEP